MNFFERLKNKCHITVCSSRDETRIVWRRRLPVWVLILSVIGFVALIFFVLAFFFGFFRSDKNSDIRRQMITYAEKIDSLENVVSSWTKYSNYVSSIASGKEIVDADKNLLPAELKPNQIGTYTETAADSAFRADFKHDEHERKQKTNEKKDVTIFSIPIKGNIVKNFNIDEKMFGIDIEVAGASNIKAAAEGVVLLAAKTDNGSYIIQLQHDNNFVSTYKNISKTEKSTGEHVSADEIIGVAGNKTNANVTSILHFELWQNGIPIDPEIYINFK